MKNENLQLKTQTHQWHIVQLPSTQPSHPLHNYLIKINDKVICLNQILTKKTFNNIKNLHFAHDVIYTLRFCFEVFPDTS